MNKLQRRQIEFVLKITERYKKNGGYIYRLDGSRSVRVRCSLADFILSEVGVLLKKTKP